MELFILVFTVLIKFALAGLVVLIGASLLLAFIMAFVVPFWPRRRNRRTARSAFSPFEEFDF